MTTDDQKTKTTEERRHPNPVLARWNEPGVVAIFSHGRPISLPIPLNGHPIEIGRGAAFGATKLEDDRISRRHTRIERYCDGIRVQDLRSHNGTFIDSKPVENDVFPRLPRILRIGNTLFRFALDIRPFLSGETFIRDNHVIGPTLGKHYEEIARIADAGETLRLTGPSGSGKELAARAFHGATKRRGPFVAVNCATIPAGLAERLLFGARRGAYSGAMDAKGHVQDADGGTLFLDEIAELDVSVQAKLLRVLDAHEVMPLGASEPQRVDIRVCTATLKDLRAEVAAGRFRSDLYYRLRMSEVRLPSLAERLEELPWLACAELQRIDPRLEPSPLFLEACALRPWPGNVRELQGELHSAARAALSTGRVVESRIVVDADHLSPFAGQEIVGQEIAVEPRPPSTASRDAAPRAPSSVFREAIEMTLQHEQGNVTRAAYALGVHRTQLRRWIARFGIDSQKR